MKTDEKILPENVKKVFFSGILGSSMSGLAVYCNEAGLDVAGSDTGFSDETRAELAGKGIAVFPEHKAENVKGSDCLVYSAAIAETNPEMRFARENGLLILSRAELLGRIASAFEHSVGVSGTHGKSTVSGTCASVFGKGTTALIGAKEALPTEKTETGNGFLVFEACEYKRSFLSVRPETAVVLNIEKEHVDCYKDVSEAIAAFSEFALGAKRRVLNFDDENVRKLQIPSAENVFFSLENETADVYGKITGEERGYYSFDTFFEGKYGFGVKLNVPGIHNVKNALAAAACGYLYGLDAEKIKAGLENFRGMKRRFEYIGMCGGSPVYDDYAHHPTEIEATLVTARKMGYKRIVCAFQPHTFSRTEAFAPAFAEVFSRYSDLTVFADIFAARETNSHGISSADLARVTKGGVYEPDHGKIAKILAENAGEDTLILTLGAGKLDSVAKTLTLL